MNVTPIILSSVLLYGCMAPTKQEVRPILTCDDCRGLNYYGPLTVAPDPRVQMAGVIARGITGVAGIIVGGQVATSIASDLASTAVTRTIANSTTETVEIIENTETTIIEQPPEPIIVTKQ